MNALTGMDFFQPERDEVAERLRKRTRRAFGLIALLFIGFFGLAALLQVGGAVVGSGDVAVDSSVKTISHSTGGILREMLVRDGDHVAEGQILMRFDTAVSQVGSQSAAESLGQLLARRARLQAEREGRAAIQFPAELTASKDPDALALMAREQRLFELRRTERTGTLELLNQRIEQYQSEIQSYQAQISATERQMTLIQPELAGLRQLHEKQLVTLDRVNAMERTAVQLEGTRAALQSNIAEARAHISETREQMLNVDKTMRSDAATQLGELEGQINDQHVRVATADDTVARSEIRAPQSGTVDKIAYTTIGSAVPPAQPILQIVPDRDVLIVEARVRPTDIDQIHAGQSARVVFSGFERQTTPDIPGKLIFVSPELTQDQRTGQSFYRVKIRLDAAALARAPQIALKAGMPAEVFISTEGRSILSFVFKPLFDQFRHAFREG
jgi:HlyD family type I secretion membrane fusion protein